MYQIQVNNAFSFDISEEDSKQLDVVETSNNQFHILSQNKTVKAKILNSDFNKKTYDVSINNTTYTVVINDTLDQQIKALGFEVGASKQVNNIKAPMPGLILEINVKVGQEVKEDDSLLILEAMKMENVITSPREGIIKSVNINQGETVDKNALLVEFE
ncbi:biotin/lipoyl-containing protein [Psychroserpens sp. XS_ASV72]|uniref:biotin/lipoyl-containing protein n=1 Tax=Psychroserpens sp. XS_ASV72 TaxID=3241293 RepID=UPI0035179342